MLYKLSPQLKLWLFLSFIIFIITAFFSEGFYHPDEHFQILEFASYKIGNSEASDLPWEFKEKIRPALQPFIAYLIIKVLIFLKVLNPFTQVTIIRLITCLLAWLVVFKLFILLEREFKSGKMKLIFLFLSFFLWFIPSLYVRFSSENFSSITLFSAVYFILLSYNKNDRKKLWYFSLAGLLLGFSFYFRFQIGFSIVGIALWLLFIKKENWRNIIFASAFGIVAISLCIAIDYWFYGSLEITPYNYFYANISKNMAAQWGIMPWWFYLNSFILSGVPPISILLLICFFIGIYLNPKSIFGWIILPFLLAHFIVGHKELRFMFPIIFGFMFIVSKGIEALLETKKYKKGTQFILVFSLIINMPILLIKMITPAQEAVSYFKYLYKLSENKRILVISSEKEMFDISGVKVNFYKNRNITNFIAEDESKITNCLNELNLKECYVLKGNIIQNYNYKGFENESIYCAYPKWIKHFNYFNWLSRSRIWEIERLKRIH
jgi:phosphatidylinositol glycan class B